MGRTQKYKANYATAKVTPYVCEVEDEIRVVEQVEDYHEIGHISLPSHLGTYRANIVSVYCRIHEKERIEIWRDTKLLAKGNTLPLTIAVAMESLMNIMGKDIQERNNKYK